MSIETQLKALLGSQREAMLSSLRELVEHESPSRDKPALDTLSHLIEARFQSLGGTVERVTNPDGGDHLIATFPVESAHRPALVLGHFDTVWPRGILEKMPFHVDGEIARGPGIYDMKAGLVLLESALRAIRALRLDLPRPIIALWTSDEEIGSPTSRTLIETKAIECDYVLVLEPPLADGRLKTARKGVGQFTVHVNGIAAHAGVEPDKGANAIVELARQVERIVALNRPEQGTTLNVGLIQGGTTPNVVPEHATATIDVRVTNIQEAHRVEQALLGLQPIDPRTKVNVTGRFNRPPMERTEAIGRLFERAREIGSRIGLELGEGATGGGSDGNFTAAAGVPTLDGLGADGQGAHALHEQIKVDSLVERSLLLACLLLHL